MTPARRTVGTTDPDVGAALGDGALVGTALVDTTLVDTALVDTTLVDTTPVDIAVGVDERRAAPSLDVGCPDDPSVVQPTVKNPDRPRASTAQARVARETVDTPSRRATRPVR